MLRCMEMMFTNTIWDIQFINRLEFEVNWITVNSRKYIIRIRDDFVTLFFLILHSLGCGSVDWLGDIFECYIHWALCLDFSVLLLDFVALPVPLDLLSCDSESYPEWVKTVLDCIGLENSVDLCPDGVGGTYFVVDKDRECIGVFKPVDEEPGAVLNPKGCLKDPLMPPGGGAIREVAAYLLDKNRFAGVPETVWLRNISHSKFNNNSDVNHLISKTGSLQKFIKNIGNSESMGSSCFSVKDVHHIGILDIRLLNLDRNGENILLVKDDSNHVRLVPIDHSYTLPETLGTFYFEWQYWRQAKVPFTDETLQFINDIDLEADCEILERLGISSRAIMNMRLATILLKKGASAGLSLFEIASWLAPRHVTEVSHFAKLVNKAHVVSTDNPNAVDKIFEQLLDELLGSCVESS